MLSHELYDAVVSRLHGNTVVISSDNDSSSFISPSIPSILDQITTTTTSAVPRFHHHHGTKPSSSIEWLFLRTYRNILAFLFTRNDTAGKVNNRSTKLLSTKERHKVNELILFIDKETLMSLLTPPTTTTTSTENSLPTTDSNESSFLPTKKLDSVYTVFRDNIYNYCAFISTINQIQTTLSISSSTESSTVYLPNQFPHELICLLPLVQILHTYPNILTSILTNTELISSIQASFGFIIDLYDRTITSLAPPLSTSTSTKQSFSIIDSVYFPAYKLAYTVWEGLVSSPTNTDSPKALITEYYRTPSMFYSDFDCTITSKDTTEMYGKFSVESQRNKNHNNNHSTVKRDTSFVESVSSSSPDQMVWDTLVNNYLHEYESMYQNLIREAMLYSSISSKSIITDQNSGILNLVYEPAKISIVMDSYDQFEAAMVTKVEEATYPNNNDRVLSGITTEQLQLISTVTKSSIEVPNFVSDCTRSLYAIGSHLSKMDTQRFGIISANWSSTFIQSSLRVHGLQYATMDPSFFTNIPIVSNNLIMVTNANNNDTSSTSQQNQRSLGTLSRHVVTPNDKFTVYRSLLYQMMDKTPHLQGLSWYIGDSPADLKILLSVDIGVIIPKHVRTGTVMDDTKSDDWISSSVSSIREVATALGIIILPLTILRRSKALGNRSMWSNLVHRIETKAKERIVNRYPLINPTSVESFTPFSTFVTERAAYDPDLHRPVLFEAENGWQDILDLIQPPSVYNDLSSNTDTMVPSCSSVFPTMVSNTVLSVTQIASTNTKANIVPMDTNVSSPTDVVPKVLIIAGSDSGGGAGIQADIKTCSALGVFSTTAVTAITAQDTCGVHGIHSIPIDLIHQQIMVVVKDMEPQIIKTGMLHNEEVIVTVANDIQALRRIPITDSTDTTSTTVSSLLPLLVLDPVMVSASGHRLIETTAVTSLVSRLFPLAHIVTPNILETEFLLDTLCNTKLTIRTVQDMVMAAELIGTFGPTFVLIKGGHLENEQSTVVTDILYETRSKQYTVFESKRTITRNTHGTGCTLASSIAACLARSIVAIQISTPIVTNMDNSNYNNIHQAYLPFIRSLTVEAVSRGREFLQTIIHGSVGLHIGQGKHGPMNHHCLIDDYKKGDTVWKAVQQSLVPVITEVSTDTVSIDRTFDLRLYAVTDSACNSKHQRTLVQAVWEAIKGGATIIQLREKHLETKDFIVSAKAVMDTIRSARKGTVEFSSLFPDIGMHPQELSKIKVLINDRIDVALAVNADGVHIGQDDMPLTIARKLLGPNAIIGVTASTPEEALEAYTNGADYLGTNAIYATATKTDHPPMGVDTLSLICKVINNRIPIVAIGGINLVNVKEVLATKVNGVAVVSAIYDKSDTVQATRELRTVIDNVLEEEKNNPSEKNYNNYRQQQAKAVPVSLRPSFRVLLKPLPSLISEKQKSLTSLPVLVPSFALACLESAQDIWKLCHHHPFVTALTNGTLPANVFRFYQMQDARYLQAFGDACCIVASRITNVADKDWFIDAAKLSLIVEKDLHLSYGKELNYTAETIDNLDLTPNNTGYTNHLLACANNGTLVEAIAALTPCPHLYGDIGRNTLEQFIVTGVTKENDCSSSSSTSTFPSSSFLSNGAAAVPYASAVRVAEIPGTHPYLRWLEKYVDESFVTYTARMLSILQEYAILYGWTENDTKSTKLDTLPKQHPLKRAELAFLNSCRYEYMFWEQAWIMQQWPGTQGK